MPGGRPQKKKGVRQSVLLSKIKEAASGVVLRETNTVDERP